jgi:predicted metal-binding transcription factor (methanogenesis marker protein 9)
MSTIAIVGHGPSMLNSSLGPTIDSYDIVIRQKAISASLVTNFAKDFGKKTSVVCGSYTIKESLFWANKANVWVFIDSRHEKIHIQEDLRFTILKDKCNYWNNFYRSLRTENFIRNEKMTIHQTSSDVGHNHMSCGLHTIMYACEILKPKKLSLFGFDNVSSGKFTWSMTRGPDWNQYPDHRWDIEKELLLTLADKYSVDFEFVKI